MLTKHISIKSPDDYGKLDEAAEILRSGGLVAFPTETVYGLGASAFDAQAAVKVYAAKGRPQDNPLIVHICETSQIDALAIKNSLALKLSAAFMPGPFTMILPKLGIIPDTVTGGLDTVALRLPSNPVAREFIRRCGIPVAAPSANTSGRPSPTCSAHVTQDLDGKIDMIIDGGSCEIGLESTVVSLVGGKCTLLRPGAVTPEMLRAVIGDVTVPENVNKTLGDGEKAICPGMKYKHYAPRAEMTLVCGSGALTELQSRLNEGCGILCFDEDLPELEGRFTLSLGSSKDSLGQANRLFDALRRFDELGVSRIFSRMPPSDGVGLAVCNRILKASAGRIEVIG